MSLLAALGLRPVGLAPPLAPLGAAQAGAGAEVADAPGNRQDTPPDSRTKHTGAYENDRSGWGFEMSDDGSGKAIKISKTIGKKEVELGAGLLHGKCTASASVFGQGARSVDGTITGTVGPEVKATAGIELGIKGFNVSLSGQATASADFWTVTRSADGQWSVAGAKPISISIGLVGEATLGAIKYSCEPVGSYEVAVLDPSIPALMPGKDLQRLHDDVEAIVGRFPEAAGTAGRMVPPESGGGPVIDPGSPLAKEVASVFGVNHLDPTQPNAMTDDDQLKRAEEQNKRTSPHYQKAVAKARLDQREQDRQAQIKQWRGPVSAARQAALQAAGWFNAAKKKGKAVSPAAEALAGQAYTRKAVLEGETDQFELSCKDTNYEPKTIGVHAQKRIAGWNEVRDLFDRGHAANSG